MSWKLFGDIGFYFATSSAAIFAVMYLFLAPWWRSTGGRNIMAVMGSLAFALVYFAWVIARGGVPDGFWATRSLIFWGIGLAIAWRVLIFAKVQVFNKGKDQDELEDAR